VLEIHPAVQALLYPPQPKALYSGKQKNRDKAAQAEGDVTFAQMTVGSMAVIEQSGFKESVFKVKLGRNLSPDLTLVKVVGRDEINRKLVLEFFKPTTFTTISSRFMNKACATKMTSFQQQPGPEWTSEHISPTDEDIAGVTVVSWDPEEGDTPCPADQYPKVVKTLQAIIAAAAAEQQQHQQQ